MGEVGPWYILAPPFLPSYLSQSFQPVLREGMASG